MADLTGGLSVGQKDFPSSPLPSETERERRFRLQAPVVVKEDDDDDVRLPSCPVDVLPSPQS